jgi:hypothetical protein
MSITLFYASIVEPDTRKGFPDCGGDIGTNVALPHHDLPVKVEHLFALHCKWTAISSLFHLPLVGAPHDCILILP